MTLSPRPVKRIVYLSIHRDEKLKESLREVSARLGIPSPIVFDDNSVDNPTFMAAFRKYSEERQQRQESISSSSNEQRKDDAVVRDGKANKTVTQPQEGAFALPKNRTKLRLVGRPSLRTSADEFFKLQQPRQSARKRPLFPNFGAEEGRQDDAKSLQRRAVFTANRCRPGEKTRGGRGGPITRSLARRDAGQGNKESHLAPKSHSLDLVLPTRKRRKLNNDTTPPFPPLPPPPTPPSPLSPSTGSASLRHDVKSGADDGKKKEDEHSSFNLEEDYMIIVDDITTLQQGVTNAETRATLKRRLSFCARLFCEQSNHLKLGIIAIDGNFHALPHSGIAHEINICKSNADYFIGKESA